MPSKKPRNKNPATLTPEQEKFVEEYLIDLNGTVAYLRAFPHCKRTTAASESSKLLRNPKVRAAVKAGRAAQARRTRVTADNVVRQYRRVAFADIGAAFDLSKSELVPLALRDVPFDVRQAIVSVKMKRRRLKSNGDEIHEVEEWEYKFADKIAALDKLSKHLGLYKELPPLEAVLALLPEPVRERVRAELAAVVFAGAGAGGAAGDESGAGGRALAGGEGEGAGKPGAAGVGPDDSVPGLEDGPGPVAAAVPLGPSPAAGDAVLPASGQDGDVGLEDFDPLFDPE